MATRAGFSFSVYFVFSLVQMVFVTFCCVRIGFCSITPNDKKWYKTLAQSINW